MRLGALVMIFLLGSCSSKASTPPRAKPRENQQPTSVKSPNAKHPPRYRLGFDAISELEKLTDAALAENRLPGGVIAFGNTLGAYYAFSFGDRSFEPEHAYNNKDTVYDLASLSKPIIAFAARQLAQDGKLKLDDPINTSLPELPFDFTIEELITHRSGLPSVTPLGDYESGKVHLIEQLKKLKLGPKEYRYSDIGYIVLGWVLEQATSLPLNALVTKYVFNPLKMNDSGYAPDLQSDQKVAPTERAPRRGNTIIHRQVHDPRAYRLGGVAGNAGIFSTVKDLSRLAKTLLDDKENVAVGWNIIAQRGTAHTRPLIGHTGYTGTRMYIDLDDGSYIIFLSNRVHPHGQTGKKDNRGAIDALVSTLRKRYRDWINSLEPIPPRAIRLGIDVFADHKTLSELRKQRVGVLTHHAARDNAHVRTIDRLLEMGVVPKKLFIPEHGLNTLTEGAGEDKTYRGIPMQRFFGKTKLPTKSDVAGLDAIIVDLVDVGMRYYTYAATAHKLLIRLDASQKMFILDRPNPLGKQIVGPISEPKYASFVNHYPLPRVHGLSMAELINLIDLEKHLPAEVVPIRFKTSAPHSFPNHKESGLSWIPPSPNLPTSRSLQYYRSLSVVEGTNISVGRGTHFPFEVVGAPWWDRSQTIPKPPTGITTTPISFVATSGRYRNARCNGMRFEVDFNVAKATQLAVYVVKVLSTQKDWQFERVANMLAHGESIQAVQDMLTAKDAVDLSAIWQAPGFERRAKRALLNAKI